jgi:hypothetical protein
VTSRLSARPPQLSRSFCGKVLEVGNYFIVVNPAKRQYIDPARFGEAIKFRAVLRGDHCLLALKLLICDRYEAGSNSICGAWLGDPVVLAGDDEGLPNPGRLVTTLPKEPNRNLHTQAKSEFVDISYRVIAELSLDRELAQILAAKAKEDKSLLIDLGAVIDQFHPDPLEYELEQAVGRPWRKEYNKAVAELSYWHPLAPIDWPL